MLLRRRKFVRETDGALALETQTRALPDTYRGRGGTFFKDIYDADHVEPRQGGRFRWMLSTCLAATVGAIAILVVVYGSSDKNAGDDGLLPALQSIRDGAMPQPLAPAPKNADGLKWVSPKSDRLQLTTGSLSTRYIIHESTKSRRDGREYVRQKPYARIVARLAPVPSNAADAIPAFNPFKLYANAQPISSNDDSDNKAGSGLSRTDVSVKVVELLGGILPGEDGQELDPQEAQELDEHSSASAQSAEAVHRSMASARHRQQTLRRRPTRKSRGNRRPRFHSARTRPIFSKALRRPTTPAEISKAVKSASSPLGARTHSQKFSEMRALNPGRCAP